MFRLRSLAIASILTVGAHAAVRGQAVAPRTRKLNPYGAASALPSIA